MYSLNDVFPGYDTKLSTFHDFYFLEKKTPKTTFFLALSVQTQVCIMLKQEHQNVQSVVYYRELLEPSLFIRLQLFLYLLDKENQESPCL